MNYDLLNKQINTSSVSLQIFNKIFELFHSFNFLDKVISVEEINSKFKLKPIISNNFSFEETNTQNFKVELINKKIYLAKKILKPIDALELENQSKIMEWCKSQGAFVPTPYKHKNNNFVFEEENYFWMIMDFIDGRNFCGLDNQISETSKSISILLSCLKNMPKDIHPFAYKKPYFTNDEHLIFDDLVSSKSEWNKVFPDFLSKKLLKNYDYITSQWNELKNYKNFNDPKINIIHNDLHPQNLIFNKNKIYIIDFESIIFGPVESCLGFSIIKLGKKIFDYDADSLNQNFKKLFMQSVNIDIKNNDLKMFGKAEVFRKFLSMINKETKKIPYTSNGPDVHIDSLKVADIIFS